MVTDCVECELCPLLTKCPETWWEALSRIGLEAMEEEGQ